MAHFSFYPQASDLPEVHSLVSNSAIGHRSTKPSNSAPVLQFGSAPSSDFLTRTIRSRDSTLSCNTRLFHVLHCVLTVVQMAVSLHVGVVRSNWVRL
jgi:hypothetical protein